MSSRWPHVSRAVPDAASDRSSTVSAIGVTTSCWKRRTGATSEASPRTYTAIGMPRFPEFTNDEHSAPIVVRPVPQPRRTPTVMKIPAAAAVESAVTSRLGDRITARSALASMVNRRAGEATWNASLLRTSRPLAPR